MISNGENSTKFINISIKMKPNIS